MSYAKPWLSYEDQLDGLIARGLAVTDRLQALACLERIGYYRLSGYWFAFRERSGPLVRLAASGGRPEKPRVETIVSDRFKPGATFQNEVDLYVFDKRLRLLVLDALERIEVARVKAHLQAFPDLSHLGLNLVGMGATPDWDARW